MIFAVPIFVAVSLLLGWAIINLVIEALAFFAGTATGFAVLSMTGSARGAVAAGLAVALAVSAGGPIIFSRLRSAPDRVALALLFAVPAAAAARYAVLAIAALVPMAAEARTFVVWPVALIVGGLAWRRLAARAARFAGPG